MIAAPSSRSSAFALLVLGVSLASSACAPAVDSGPLDRTKAPTLSAPGALKLPPIVRKELPNGLDIMMVEHHELPVVNFVMLTSAGPEADPVGKEGLATLTAALLDEGSKKRDALAIADQMAFYGASLGTTGNWDNSRVTLQTTTAQLDSAAALFAEVILDPAFPESEVERLRRERMTTILQMQDNPTQVADVAFARIVFGDGNPYGRPVLGTEASVSAISRQDVESFHRTFYRPNNSTLIIVGDFSAAEMEQRVQRLFGGWERADVPAVKTVDAQARSASGIYIIDKPGSPQSSIRIGHVGVARSTPDYFGLSVANTILGGAFTSRLNLNLREAKGYTYGATSRFDMRKTPGPFSARAEVVAEKTDSAVIEFMKELNSIREPVPAEELEKAKQYMQLTLPSSFEVTGDLANQLVPLALHGLPLDFYNHYGDSINAVSQDVVKRVTAAHLDPSRMAIVIVGDRKMIEPGLKKLGIGEVSVRAVDGGPVRR